jgi:ferrous-iron efflux pump FieF
LFIIASAGVITFAAVMRLLAGDSVMPQQEEKGIAVVVFAIVVTGGLVFWQRRVAVKTGNKVVAADSLHYIGDMVPNLGAVVALYASSRFGLNEIDSVVAIGAALFMAFGAIRIGKAAWDALMDRRADPAMLEGIAKIAGSYPGVHGFHDLKSRQAGSRVFVNLHIELDGDQTLTEAHAIGAGLRRAIIAAYPNADVLIHKDPLGDPGDD